MTAFYRPTRSPLPTAYRKRWSAFSACILDLLYLTQPFMSWLVRPVLVSSLLALLGVGLDTRPAPAQALLPYTLPLDEERLTATGFQLAQEALDRFEIAETTIRRRTNNIEGTVRVSCSVGS